MKLSANAREQADMLEEVIHEILEPSRRSFLRKGMLAAAAIAALPTIGALTTSCSDDSGTNPTVDPNQQDITILTNSYLIEKLAVNTYNVAAGTGLLSGAFLEVAGSFINDHTGHAGTFRDVIVGELKGAAPTDPMVSENFVTGMMRNGKREFMIQPVFGNLTSAEGIVKYALALELTAAKEYFESATSATANIRLTNKKALEAVQDIGPVEAEHAAVFRAALKLLLNTATDADAGANIGRSVSPHSTLSAEMPRP
jgi:hypothetical protein